MSCCCWWCTLEIEGDIKRLPYNYDNKRRKFHTMGQFCSWECVKTYNLKSRVHKSGEICGFITLYRKHLYGKTTPLGCAPSRWCLKKFGGDMSEEEFKKSFGPDPPIVRMPDTERFIHGTIERVKLPSKDKTLTNKQRLDTINNSVAKTETLKLKRPTPIKHKSNNLESALGLVRKNTVTCSP